MDKTRKIIGLVDKIDRELENFIPCLNLEIEAKTSINQYLMDIRSLADEIKTSHLFKGHRKYM